MTRQLSLAIGSSDQFPELPGTGDIKHLTQVPVHGPEPVPNYSKKSPTISTVPVVPLTGEENTGTDSLVPPSSSAALALRSQRTELGVGRPADPIGSPTLRPYQAAAIAAVLAEFAAGRNSTLLVLPTGTGKTVVFAEMVRLEVVAGIRSLVLAHRTELIDQATRKLADVGIRAQIDQAGSRASLAAMVVVASVQTLRGKRLERYPRDHFGLVVVDEAHHAAAKGYRNILDWFGGDA